MSRRTAPSRPPHRYAVALVALCLLLSGVAPSVSWALAAASAHALHDLCAADGSRPVSPVGHHGGTDDVACAMCSVHGGTHAAPGGAPAVRFEPEAGPGPAARAPAGPAPRGGRIAHEPRGPPAVPAFA